MLIDHYRAIEVSSIRMLEAAKAKDWSGVIKCEGVCATLIQQLRDTAKVEELDAASRAEKSKIMLRILQNDAQIRYLAEPALAQIELGSSQSTQYLH